MAKRTSRGQTQAKKQLAKIGSGESSPVGSIDAIVEMLDEVLPDWNLNWLQAVEGTATEWLRRLTTEWYSFAADDPRYTDWDVDAIDRLCLCGLVEQRLQCRATKPGSLDCVDFTCVVSGNCQAKPKLSKALAKKLPEWCGRVLVRPHKTSEVRLTFKGEGARADLLSGDEIKAAEVRIFTRGCTPEHKGRNPAQGTAVIEGEVSISRPFSDEGRTAERKTVWKNLNAKILEFRSEYNGRWPLTLEERKSVAAAYNQRFGGTPGFKKATYKTVSQQVDTLKKKRGC